MYFCNSECTVQDLIPCQEIVMDQINPIVFELPYATLYATCCSLVLGLHALIIEEQMLGAPCFFTESWTETRGGGSLCYSEEWKQNHFDLIIAEWNYLLQNASLLQGECSSSKRDMENPPDVKTQLFEVYARQPISGSESSHMHEAISGHCALSAT